MPTRRAQLDTSLQAIVVSRRPLRYRAGPDPALDRPTHLRAGSSLSWVGERLALVQDDTNFVALVDPGTGLAEAITLPAGEGGLRQFDDTRGNKKFKLDLEACCVVAGPEGPVLIALGSGSKKRRRRVVLLDGWRRSSPNVSLVDAGSLYAALDGATAFSGSEMNIEGVLVLPGTLRLFGRGNGAPRRGRLPLNATCDLALSALLAYLAAPDVSPAPRPTAIHQFELGQLHGLPLGFTDATLCGGAVLYTAAAEASSSASEDGRVSGSVVGVLPARGELRYAPLTDSSGAATREKIEGVAALPDASDRVLVVTDADDADRPSELCEVRLEGSWR